MRKCLFVALLFAIGCSQDDDAPVRVESEYKIIYKGKLYADQAALESLGSTTGFLFNDYAENPNTDYMFDSQEELLSFASQKYSKRVYSSIYRNFNPEEGSSTSSNGKTLSWGYQGTTQWTEEHCNDWSYLLCNGWPDGEVPDFSDPYDNCGFYPKSFNANVPAGESITMTYFKYRNFSINSNCPAGSMRTVVFTEGTGCVDVKFRLSCTNPLLIPSQAGSARWTSTNN